MWNCNMPVNRFVGTYYFRMKGAYFDHLDYVAFDSRYDVPSFVCFNCWQWGHSQLGCRQPRKHTFCVNCGRINTTVDQCPRCARTYHKLLLNQPKKKAIVCNSIKESFKRDPSIQPWKCKREAKGSFFKDVDEIPFDPKVDVPYGVCFNCWEFGHAKPNCLMPKLTDHCNNCGRIGVKVSNCPRCSNAAHRYWQQQTKVASHELESKVSQVKEKQDSGGEVRDASLHSITIQTTEGSFLQDEDDNYDDVIFEENEESQNLLGTFVKKPTKEKESNYEDVLVDENEDSCVITGAFLDSFLHLMNAIKCLPVEERNIIAHNFVTARRERITRKKTSMSLS